MEKDKIILENQRFFCVTFGLIAVVDPNFKDAVFVSFNEPVQYGAEAGGYIRIDCTKVKQACSQKSFAAEVRNEIFERVGAQVPAKITGELADEAEVVIDDYKFIFRISQYERDRRHNYALVEASDLAGLPENERLGRIMELQVTVPAILGDIA